MAENHRISLGEFSEDYADDWVLIRPKRSWAARQRIEQSAMVFSPAETENEDGVQKRTVRGEVDLLAYGIAVLEAAIVEWSLCDEAGNPLPASRAGFEHDDFDEDLGDWLIKAIERYYASRKRSKAERKTSAGS